MVDRMMDQNAVELMVGPSGSSMPRLPQAKRLEARKWLSATSESEKLLPLESHLRARLICRLPVPSDLLNPAVISRALSPSDALRYAPMLSVVTTKVDTSLLFRAIAKVFEESVSSVSVQTLRRICVGLKGWKRWVASRSAKLSCETAIELLNLCVLLLTRVHEPRKRAQGLREQTVSVVRVLLSLSVPPPNLLLKAGPSLASLRLLSAVRNAVGEDAFEDFVACDEGKKWVDPLRDGLPEVFEELAVAGLVNELTELSRLSQMVPGHESAVRQSANNLWKSKVAFLSGHVQKWLEEYLGIAQGPGLVLEFVMKSERPEMPQLALALLRAWEARETGDAARGAFEALEGVCGKFFGIRLGGEAGSRVMFDHRFHESEHGLREGGMVVIRRPWVEWRDGQQWKVLIRALVGRSS